MIESIWSPANFRFGTLARAGAPAIARTEFSRAGWTMNRAGIWHCCIFRNSRQCDNRFSIVSRVSGRRCAGWELPRTIDREAPPLRSLSVFIS